MPAAFRRSVEPLELETAPLMAMRCAASSSMRKFTVDPVPTPSTLPGVTNSSAARAAACFPVFWLIADSFGPLKRQSPHYAGSVFEFSGEREMLSLALSTKAEELLLLGFLLGLLLGFRHGASPVVTG